MKMPVLQTALAFSCLAAGCAHTLSQSQPLQDASQGANTSQIVLLTNDDGWAVAQIRAQYAALAGAGFDVILSAPAENQSGAGSASRAPTPLTEPCEYDSCPTGSPAVGYNASDPSLNYVNAYPVDAARYGIQNRTGELYPGSKPDFVVSGPNIGNNMGLVVLFSGTVGAACEAAKEGIPAAAFSGDSGSQVSYTTLAGTPNATSTRAAHTYAALTAHFTRTLLASAASAPGALLPPGVIVNVNYPSVAACPDAAQYRWVFARNLPNILGATDVATCGGTSLPYESEVVGAKGCYASVAVLGAESKGDVNATVQGAVLEWLGGLPLSCLSS
ncbi:hypothetical protein AcW1_002279 [Taiwanofungus camphoratus]|nr:hypothetical protein AcW1_002279 [Antrodia cinnamomea]